MGGENIDDVQHIRDDTGLAGIVGYTLPAPATARQWLDSFHDETLMLNRPLQGSFIPFESPNLFLFFFDGLEIDSVGHGEGSKD